MLVLEKLDMSNVLDPEVEKYFTNVFKKNSGELSKGNDVSCHLRIK